MIIGICGDSGSGKTTLAKAVEKCLGDVLLFECDRYHKWVRTSENWKNYTHLNPDANHISNMRDDIIRLKAGYKFWSSDYCHDSGTFTKEKLVVPTDKIVVLGLHTLMNSVHQLFDLKIFMDTDQDLKKHWKVNRDVKERGYSLDQVLEKIKKREGDYLRYIYPQRNNADLIVQFNESGLKLQFNDKFDLSSITGKLHEKSVNYAISFSPITMNFPSAFNYDIITLFIMDWYDKFTRNQ